jgi:hypothetical protein
MSSSVEDHERVKRSLSCETMSKTRVGLCAVASIGSAAATFEYRVISYH